MGRACAADGDQEARPRTDAAILSASTPSLGVRSDAIHPESSANRRAAADNSAHSPRAARSNPHQKTRFRSGRVLREHLLGVVQLADCRGTDAFRLDGPEPRRHASC